ncbi:MULTISPECIES: hypothetical protein [Rheinheimera]|uniref:Uncharacterized protein n=1 Tax=Rheinheimera aquimaris TaxID=412437 RepID=A0ABN1DTX7_9GAMM|nr:MULTISPECIES: hypothetical protein [Rheinheimera]MCB5214303.1 hypothetical protein [Rheinheimera aquimaris]
MQDQQYDGVVLEDKWGKSYLCSSCLLAYADLGEDSLGDVKDTEFGRYFLHDLEPSWDQRNIWAQLYQHARPWATDLSKLNKFQLRDALLQMFARDEMRIWQLTDGWGKAPEGNGIGDGGLAPASSGGASPAPAAKASKPKGGGVVTDRSEKEPLLHHSATKPTEVALSRDELENNILLSVGEGFKNNPLRQEYEQEVAALSKYADKIKPNSTLKELEELANEANEARRQLGVKYKNATPEPLRDFIYEVNKSRYDGDPLGPTVDFLVNVKDKSYTDIIRSASRPNPDVDKLLAGFSDWLKKQSPEYLIKHQP